MRKTGSPMIWKGFKFGMLLQLAVGPMCLFVFNTAAKHGLWTGLSVVLAIALVDALFILLSGIGVGAALQKEKVKSAVKVCGALILLLFGANMIAGAFGLSLLPNIALFARADKGSFFVQGLLLTASNPLTIVFWSGVFSTQVLENNYGKTQMVGFGAGCVLATLAFLSLVAILGTALGGFLPAFVMRILNIAVGCLLIFFSIRSLYRRAA